VEGFWGIETLQTRLIPSFSLGLELQQRAACWLKFSWQKWKEIVVHGSELETARVLLS
jgi:hypothetical protein